MSQDSQSRMSAENQPTLTLSDGTVIPQFGFGTWELSDEDAYASVREAIKAGYRRIDTAMIYKNEEATGKAIADAIAEGDVTREELTVSTKVWNADQGFEETLQAFEDSITRLGLEYVDVYFIHWPCPDKGAFVDTYKAMMRLQGMGRIQSLAVCNFYEETMDELVAKRDSTPTINQIEIHPGFSQAKLREYNAGRSIVTESWSPLGHGKFFDHPAIAEPAEKYGKSPAQIVLRWHIELGLSVLTRSSNVERVRSNFDIFDFSLTPEEVDRITALDSEGSRLGPDPREFNA